MRPSHSLAPLLCGIASALFSAAIVMIAPGLVMAEEKSQGSVCSCPQNETPEPPKLWPKPKFAGVRPALDSSDEVAALEAIHLALTEVGDGSSYVWHRRAGRLSGVVKPTTSFKDGSGKICRHLVIELSAAAYTRSTEGIACRLGNGAWQLEG